jgi:hypothetical protein
MALTELLRPFVFRRYIDFGVIDGLRQMKAMIAAEVRRKGLEGNIKLGAGGIREVEFIAQALQLIRGGREPALRVRHLPEALAAIAQGRPGGEPVRTPAHRLSLPAPGGKHLAGDRRSADPDSAHRGSGSPAAHRHPRLYRLGRLHGPPR